MWSGAYPLASDVVVVHVPELGLVNRRGVAREWRIPLDYAKGDAYYLVDVG